MASNGPPPKHDMRFPASPPPPLKGSLPIALSERILMHMDVGNIVSAGLLGIALASSSDTNEEGPE